MNRKQWLIAAGLVGLLGLVAVICVAALFSSRPEDQGEVAEITLCDDDSARLCIVSFGSDVYGRMLINFLLPDPDIPDFYLKVHHGGTARLFECLDVEGFPENVYCAGPRTPLGEPILIEVYSSGDDLLLARGVFIVSAIALPTNVSVSTTPESPTITPGGPLDTPSPLPPPSRTPFVTDSTTATPLATATSTSESYPNP